MAELSGKGLLLQAFLRRYAAELGGGKPRTGEGGDVGAEFHALPPAGS
jgi:hypothetical protein